MYARCCKSYIIIIISSSIVITMIVIRGSDHILPNSCSSRAEKKDTLFSSTTDDLEESFPDEPEATISSEEGACWHITFVCEKDSELVRYSSV